MSEKNRNPFVGLWALVCKFGPKLFSVLAKLAKTIKFGKLALAGSSMAVYSVLLSWQFALAIMVTLFIHESGHLFAMKRFGMRTKGIYFIPLFGGAAVTDEAFASRWAESVVAIAGPIAGLLLALLTVVIYSITGGPMWAAIAGWMGFVNLFNLLPINPLDGGRILKSIAFSLHSWAGMAVMVLSIVCGAVGAFKFGLGLLGVMAVVGAIEFVGEYISHLHHERVARELKDELSIDMPPPKPIMTRGQLLGSIAAYVVVAASLLAVMYLMDHEPGAQAALELLK